MGSVCGLHERSRIRQSARDSKGAIDDIERAIVLRPGAKYLLARRASVLAASERWEPAALDLLAVLRVDPTNRTARDWHADVVKGVTFDA